MKRVDFFPAGPLCGFPPGGSLYVRCSCWGPAPNLPPFGPRSLPLLLSLSLGPVFPLVPRHRLPVRRLRLRARAGRALCAGLQRLRDVHVSGAGLCGLRVESARRTAPLALALHPRLSSLGLIFARLVVARGAARGPGVVPSTLIGAAAASLGALRACVQVALPFGTVRARARGVALAQLYCKGSGWLGVLCLVGCVFRGRCGWFMLVMCCRGSVWSCSF